MNKKIVNNYKCILNFTQQTQQFHSSFTGKKKGEQFQPLPLFKQMNTQIYKAS